MDLYHIYSVIKYKYVGITEPVFSCSKIVVSAFFFFYIIKQTLFALSQLALCMRGLYLSFDSSTHNESNSSMFPVTG